MGDPLITGYTGDAGSIRLVIQPSHGLGLPGLAHPLLLTFGRTGDEHSLLGCDLRSPDGNPAAASIVCRFDARTAGLWNKDGYEYAVLRARTTSGNTMRWRAAVNVRTTPPPIGFVEREPFLGDCRNLPAGSACLEYADRYVWKVHDHLEGPSESQTGQNTDIKVVRGRRANYHHILGTWFVREVVR
jgi:hypothetical protein